jgi:hypothetical protein
MHIAHETAGAARTWSSSSLRPLIFRGARFPAKLGRFAPRECEVVFRPINVIARSEATKQSIARRKERMDCFASLAMTENLPEAGGNRSKNKQRQLIERIGDFEAHQNQRGDHQIKAEMHERLETNTFAACADPVPPTPSKMTPTKITACRDTRASGCSIVSTGTEGLRRRGSDALVASLFLSGGLCSDESFLSAHMPWKILIPHSTTTMADTSVAAVNTLSKEATLMLLSASQPH